MTRICEVCGKEFDANRRQICCSDECKRIRKNLKTRLWLTDNTGKVYDSKPTRCPFCGEIYMPKRSTQVSCLKPECKRAADRARKHRQKCPEPVTRYHDFPDAEHYASNQMAATLANVPKIRVEL